MNKRIFVTPVLMWLIVFSGIALIFWIVPSFTVIAYKPIGLLFLPAFMYWSYFFFGALWKNRQAARSVEGINKLATTGVYAKVRHPIYAADIVLSWGLFFLFPSLRALLSILWMNVVLLQWMKLEEEFLTDKFGAQYELYKKRTPKMFPRI